MEVPEFKLGVVVEDLVSGLSGYVTRKVHYASGAIQYCIQPRGEDGKMPEAYWIDPHTLQFLEEGVSDRLMPTQEHPEWLKFGAHCRDVISGFTGKVEAYIYEQNGCIGVTLVGDKYDRDNRPVMYPTTLTNLELVKQTERQPAQPKRTGPAPRRGSEIPRSR